MISQKLYFEGKEWVLLFHLKLSSTELSKLTPNITFLWFPAVFEIKSNFLCVAIWLFSIWSDLRPQVLPWFCLH